MTIINKDTVVISGFPGIGKTYAQQHSSGIVLDSDSSRFSWARNADGTVKIDANGTKLRHPEFPKNYMEHIKGNIGKADIIYVSSHDNVREALNKAKIPHVLVYPSYEMKEEMVQRYIDRGSSKGFVELIKNNWDNFISGMKKDPCPNKIELKPGEFLADVIEKAKEMLTSKKIKVIK